MITLKMNVGGVTRSLDLLVDSLKPSALKKPLQAISTLKQAEVRQRFEQSGPGWEPRAASTLAQEARRMSQAQSKAQTQAGKKIATRLGKQLRDAIKRGAKESTLERRRLEIAVLRQLRGMDTGTLSANVKGALDRADAKALAKAQQRLFKRGLRATEQSTGRLLGKIANSIQARIDGMALVVESSVSWSGAQNNGAVVGNGAKLTARTFLEWTDGDLEAAAKAFEDHMISAVVR